MFCTVGMLHSNPLSTALKIFISNHNLHPESLLVPEYRKIRDLNLNGRLSWPRNLSTSPIKWVTGYGDCHSYPFMEPVGEAKSISLKSCGSRWHLRCPHSVLPHWWRWITLQHWLLILVYSPHMTGRLSQIRKTPATWARTMEMPAKPWFMWRWIRCIYYFISSNKQRLPSCHGWTVSVNACHTCIVLYTVLLPACGVGLQIKSNHHYSGLIIQLYNEIGHPFLLPSHAYQVVIVLTVWGTSEEINKCAFQTQQTKGKLHIAGRNELISVKLQHPYYTASSFLIAVQSETLQGMMLSFKKHNL